MNLLDLISLAIKEDMPNGDLTTESLGVRPVQGVARLIAKQDMVLSGASIFEQTMLFLEPQAKLKWHFEEGQKILKTQVICTLQGNLVQLIKAERVALNFLIRLSGISTLTRKFVDAVAGTQTRILDTRKTTPAFRQLEKKAVIHGGGFNHRLSLSDAILIKDNHIALCGGVREAITRVKQNTTLPVEVEVSNLADISTCLELKVERILLDNMTDAQIAEAVKLVSGRAQLEASGNMSLDRVGKVAKLGVDFISVGALTHSAPSCDVSLLFDGAKK
jgi:nicotinate-nucleotide pyrophosphorylase (carboxylating)